MTNKTYETIKTVLVIIAGMFLLGGFSASSYNITIGWKIGWGGFWIMCILLFLFCAGCSGSHNSDNKSDNK